MKREILLWLVPMRRILFISYLLFSPLVQANDSSSAIGAGGLVPRPNARVRMESEELKISPDRIQVAYVFFNPTSEDDHTTVSFPLPDLRTAEIDQVITALRATKTGDTSNLVDFYVEVDGKKISPQIEQRAWLGSRDVTALLKELRLPLIPWYPDLDSYSEALRRLSSKDRARLVAAGMVHKDSLTVEMTDNGNGREWDPLFRYVVRTSYYWKQTFPKNSRVKVVHRYRPLSGSSFGPYGASEEVVLADEMRSLDEAGFCGSSSDFFAKPPSGDEVCRSNQSIEYILTTAKTWKGPIGDFRLNLSGMRFVFTCFEGLTRTGSDTWELVAKDFVPSKELKVAFCPTSPGGTPGID
jgi:hypothetical protein